MGEALPLGRLAAYRLSISSGDIGAVVVRWVYTGSEMERRYSLLGSGECPSWDPDLEPERITG